MLISFNLMLNLTTFAASSLTALSILAQTSVLASTISKTDIVTNSQTQTIEQIESGKTKEKRFICKGCNDNESAALNFFQDKGITDKNALATILGNIKQESTFIPNICEGGALTTYERCRAGGFGLIQFTSSDRYYGLGNFARRVGGDPSSLDTQLNYMIEEPQWLRIQERMRTPGKPIERYMAYSYSWIGWGIHGARTAYAYDYARRIVLSESDS
jgi:hypothetical protein